MIQIEDTGTQDQWHVQVLGDTVLVCLQNVFWLVNAE